MIRFPGFRFEFGTLDPPHGARDRFSTDVTFRIGPRDHAVAGITSGHEPLKAARPAMSMDRVYLSEVGTLVSGD